MPNVFTPLLAQVERLDDAGVWMPGQVGNHAADVDTLFHYILWVSVFFTIVIGSLMVLFVVRNRQRSKSDRHVVKRGATHNTLLEVAWTVPPLLIVLGIFLLGFRGYVRMDQIPQNNVYEIDVEAYQWGWQFSYPGGGQTGGASAIGDGVIIHIPADRPVKFNLASRDVIHSFYVPTMRLKKDCVPGRYNTAWVEIDSEEQGITPGNPKTVLFHCTEYCGDSHSQMNGYVVIHHPDSFFRGVNQEDNQPVIEAVNKFPSDEMTPIEVGEWVWGQMGGCKNCHSIDGSAANAPTWQNIFAEQRGGKPVDDAYILESIYYPGNWLVPGWGNNMASYRGQLNYGHVRGVIAYMKSLTEGYDGPILKEWPGGEAYQGDVWINDKGEEAPVPEDWEPN